MKRESDNHGSVETVSLILAVAIVASVFIPTFAAQPDKSENRTIVPNIEIQSYLRGLLSTNKQVMFEGTEASLLERFGQLRKLAGDDRDLVLQLLYFHAHAKTENEYRLPWVIVKRLAISNETFATVGLSLLDSDDEAGRKMGADCLTRVDYDPKGGVDFSRYESILREKKQNLPQGLIRYMYNRNPQAAVVTVARVYGQDVPESEVAAKAKNGVKESTAYFSGRPEWWAHLYVATMMEKEPYLHTPEMVKKLEQDTDPLIREKVSKLKQNQAPSKGEGVSPTNKP